MAEPAPQEEPTAMVPVENQVLRNPESASVPRATAAERARKNKKKR